MKFKLFDKVRLIEPSEFIGETVGIVTDWNAADSEVFVTFVPGWTNIAVSTGFWYKETNLEKA